MTGSAGSDPEQVAAEVGARLMAADRVAGALGIELDAVGPGYARVRMLVTEEHVNGVGTCHGGVLFTLADTAFAIACNSHGSPTVAGGCDIVFARPVVPGEMVLAEASERTRFGRSGIYDVTLTRADGEVVAEVRARPTVVPV